MTERRGAYLSGSLSPVSTERDRRFRRAGTRRKMNVSIFFFALFQPAKKDEDKNKSDRLGHGRAIPLKQVGIEQKRASLAAMLSFLLHP